MVHSIARLWRLEKVKGNLRWYLPPLSPLPDILEVATHMLSIEVDICLWTLGSGRLEPDLAHNADVDCTHELLADNVQAVCCETSASVGDSKNGGRDRTRSDSQICFRRI